ncbi:hypothetical protein Bbelb_161540 [Branchiostoma belcheri]|nr:hypothetical protein Bbelb_161540 [Branchiostoma belcheri]
MKKSDIVIRELRQEETEEVTDMVLSGVREKRLGKRQVIRNAVGLMLTSESLAWIAFLSAMFYILTNSVPLSILMALLVAFLSSLWYLWTEYRQNISRNAEELQDLYTWYATKPGSKFWVVVYQQRIIGSVALHRVSDTVAQLKRMSVLSMYRRQGVGTIMVNHFEEYCRFVGIKEVFLITVASFGYGVHLYRKCGYVMSSRVRRILPLPGAFLIVWKMSKKL